MVPIIIVDCGDKDSLSHMAHMCKVVLNCVGPYSILGEQVVGACVSAGTSYLDICGEPNFQDMCRETFSADAKKSGSIIVNACGFDSVPNDFGFALMRKKLPKAQSIESFIDTDIGPDGTVIHVTTLESLMIALSDVKALWKRIRGISDYKPLSGQRVLPFTDARFPGRVMAPFPGGDIEIVDRTTRAAGRQDFQRGLYITTKSWIDLVSIVLGVALLMVLAFIPGMRKLVINHPEIFTLGKVTKKGPSDNQRNGTKGSVYISGKDQNGLEERIVITLTDLGYAATGALIGELGITLATKRESELPHEYKTAGGVVTPAIVFVERNGEKSHVIKRLNCGNLVHFRL
jgi:short subunit dehydrogenase-like uncharacterized protein